jgi:hypothetical protein
MNRYSPSVGSRFVDAGGQSFEVIGTGTGGIVIEYSDGRAELIDQHSWESLQANPELNRSSIQSKQ